MGTTASIGYGAEINTLRYCEEKKMSKGKISLEWPQIVRHPRYIADEMQIFPLRMFNLGSNILKDRMPGLYYK